MKNNFKKLLFCLFIFTSVQTIAQTASLKVEVSIDYEYDAYDFSLVKDKDTIGRYTLDEYGFPTIIDSLEAGEYRIYVYSNDNSDYILQKTVVLKEGMQTRVNVSLYYNEYTDYPEEEDFKQKSESQFGAGYFNGNWTDPTTIVKDNFFISMDAYYWNAFSKHAGFLLGSGFNVSQHYFQKDTTYFENIAFKKIFERYTSINLNYEAKFRLSTGNQQLDDLSPSKFFVEFGARYNLPILFNHAAMYRGSKKLIERNIHNFKDFRAFVNIGFAPVTFFMEYRLSDFIRADNPQLPKFNAGIKLMFSY